MIMMGIGHGMVGVRIMVGQAGLRKRRQKSVNGQVLMNSIVPTTQILRFCTGSVTCLSDIWYLCLFRDT